MKTRAVPPILTALLISLIVASCGPTPSGSPIAVLRPGAGIVKVEGRPVSGTNALSRDAVLTVMPSSRAELQIGTGHRFLVGPGKYRLLSRDALEILAGDVTASLEAGAEDPPFVFVTKPARMTARTALLAIHVDGATGNFPAKASLCVAGGSAEAERVGQGAAPYVLGTNQTLSILEGMPATGPASLDPAWGARIRNEYREYLAGKGTP
ncbi:MAG: hypothetical protein J0L75_21320 [Spirochaetes bacterium]|nr:hypothetical protein [Spirochaetota bacterium]